MTNNIQLKGDATCQTTYLSFTCKGQITIGNAKVERALPKGPTGHSRVNCLAAVAVAGAACARYRCFRVG